MTHRISDKNGGEFMLDVIGDSLVLNFIPVPEPSTPLLIMIAVLFAVIFRRRDSTRC